MKYLDIPIQHANDKLLRAMNRRGTKAEIMALFEILRARIPGLVIRTSLITGLPGEGEAEFEELCDFLRWAKLERAGIFPFSPQEGTPAFDMPGQVGEVEAVRRASCWWSFRAGSWTNITSNGWERPWRSCVRALTPPPGVMRAAAMPTPPTWMVTSTSPLREGSPKVSWSGCVSLERQTAT